MIKNYLIIFTVLFSFSGDRCSKVIIDYVRFSILTPIKVHCNDFESAFGDQIKRFVITDEDKIDSLLLYVKKLKEDSLGKQPDVRLRMCLFYSNKIDTICMGETRILLNGTPMQSSKEFTNLVKKIILQ